MAVKCQFEKYVSAPLWRLTACTCVQTFTCLIIHTEKGMILNDDKCKALQGIFNTVYAILDTYGIL